MSSSSASTSDVVYFVASSLDGYTADGQGSLDWLTSIDSGELPLTEDFTATVGVQVMDSATYEWVLTHENLLEPQKWAEFFGDLPTVVFSSRALPIPTGAEVTVVAGSPSSHLGLLRGSAGGRGIWVVGGGDVAAQFLTEGLLDWVEITYAPTVLGSGAPLLPARADSRVLRLRTVARHGPFVHEVYDVADFTRQRHSQLGF